MVLERDTSRQSEHHRVGGEAEGGGHLATSGFFIYPERGVDRDCRVLVKDDKHCPLVALGGVGFNMQQRVKSEVIGDARN